MWNLITILDINKSSTKLVCIKYLNSRHEFQNILTYLSARNYSTFLKTAPSRTVRTDGAPSCGQSPLILSDSSDKENTNFFEWLSGFTDAEGYFYIVAGKSYSFRFQINLHKDDLKVLHYIQESLGFGEVRSYKDFSSFTVTRFKDISQLINIFDTYPLQGSKWLNYKDFVEAFKLYTDTDRSAEVLAKIIDIKNNMNSLRSDYSISEDKVINLTPYWLLGFIEGDGSFSINKRNQYRLDFSMSQSYTNKDLMKSIKVYLENLPNTEGNYEGAIGISDVSINKPNQKSTTRIETARMSYITNIFIPFLESLTWQSKKYLDFLDWKNILKLKEKGHHLSEEGINLIELIISQMNNNRLSTSKTVKHKDKNRDRELLLNHINNMLKGPSNFETRNGRLFVISLNKYYHSSRVNKNVVIVDEKGNKLHSFHSLAECAVFLNIHSSTVSKRKIRNIPFLLENKTVYIKEDEDNE
nr:hypothetical protein [Ceratocystis fimbriata]